MQLNLSKTAEPQPKFSKKLNFEKENQNSPQFTINNARKWSLI